MNYFCLFIAALQLNSTMQEIFTEEYLHPISTETVVEKTPPPPTRTPWSILHFFND